MDIAGAHVSYVMVSYAVTAAALAILAVMILRRDRRLKRELARLETETVDER